VFKLLVWKGTPNASLKALQSMLCNFFSSALGALKKTSWA